MGEFRLETGRLILRQWREADRQPFAAINADAEVTRHLDGPLERGESDDLLDQLATIQRDHGHSYWAVETKPDRQLIGFCGVCPGRHEATPVGSELDMGWRLARSAWGKGLAHEAAVATLAWAWANLGVSRLAAWTVAANTRSWGLMVRLGMQRRPDLDFSHPAFPPGHPLREHIVYAIDRPR